jgi:polyphenol oxidase
VVVAAPQAAAWATARPASEVPSAPAAPGVSIVAEQRLDAVPGLPLYSHPAWHASLPWIVQGTTGRASDMSLFGRSPAGDVVQRWLRLRESLGCTALVHARQVHAANVLVHGDVPAGILIAGDADGHATTHTGVALAVSVADCVPIFIVAPEARAVALLHGGWRGVAAGILERGVARLVADLGAEPAELHVHFGPAICGECFEVGAEVPRALGAAEGREGKQHLDLRAVLADRARAMGIVQEHLSTSAYCTRCGDSPFFSHRAGCRERQIAVLGIRPAAH